MTESMMEPTSQAAESEEKTNRTLVGRVVSDAMDKTITVLIERRVQHPLYGKYMTRSSKVHAHDAENLGSRGDLVRVEQCRPLSKTKSWRLIEIVEKAR
jgi:small subunit ribosomal protein S17